MFEAWEQLLAQTIHLIILHSASAGKRRQASERFEQEAPEAREGFAKRQKSKAAACRQESASADSDAASEKSTQRRASARVRKPSSKSIAAGRTLQEPKRTNKSRSASVKQATRSRGAHSVLEEQGQPVEMLQNAADPVHQPAPRESLRLAVKPNSRHRRRAGIEAEAVAEADPGPKGLLTERHNPLHGEQRKIAPSDVNAQAGGAEEQRGTRAQAAVTHSRQATVLQSDESQEKPQANRGDTASVRLIQQPASSSGDQPFQEQQNTENAAKKHAKLESTTCNSDPASKPAAMGRSHQTLAQSAALGLKRKAAVQPVVQADEEQEPTGAARNSKSRRQHRTATANRSEAITATPKRKPRDPARKKQASLSCCVLLCALDSSSQYC